MFKVWTKFGNGFRLIYWGVSLLVFHPEVGNSQVSGFLVPDTICINTPVSIVNQIATGSTYYWNFCSANLSTVPIGTNLGNPFGQLDIPVYSQLIKQGNDHFLFQVSANGSGSGNGKVVRYFLGNSFSNLPVSYTLMPNSLVHWNAECIRILLDDNGNYYGFLTNGLNNNILRFEFGADLWNMPTVTNLGNIGNLDMPHGLEIVRDNGQWYGFITNSYGNTISRLNWGTSLANLPTGVNLGNLGSLNAPKALQMIKDASQNWYLFATNYNTSSLTRLSFGSSLANTPLGWNSGAVNGINGPEGITMLKDCDNYFGYVANYAVGANSLCRITFPLGLNGQVNGTNIGNIGNMFRPGHFSNIFRQNDTLFMYVGNKGTGPTLHSIIRIQFNNCNTSSITSSTLQNPPSFSYSTPGTYNISLIVDEGMPTQQVYCHDIVVVDHYPLTIYQNNALCTGDSAMLTASGNYSGYLWNTGDTIKSIYVTTPGSYWVKVYANTQCESVDTAIVPIYNAIPVELGPDQSICPVESITLLPNQPFSGYQWSTGQTQNSISVNQTGTYWLNVTDIHGCHSADTINILPDTGYVTQIQQTICPGTGYYAGGQIQHQAGIYVDTLLSVFQCDSILITQLSLFNLPVINLSPTANFCPGDSISINAFSGNFQYAWNTGSSSSSIVVSQPGIYYLTVTDSNNCVSKDSINVIHFPLPLPDLGNDTTICVYQTIFLDPGNGFNSYQWNNGDTTQQISVSTTGTYHIVVTNSFGCAGYDTVYVDVMPQPVINLGNDTILCIGLSVVLDPGSGYSSYLWNNGAQTQTLAAQLTGNYTVTVTYGPQCQATDSVEVGFVLGNMIDLGQDTSFCNGNSINLNPGSGFATYTWSNGSQNQSIMVNQSGIYSVAVTRPDGCFDIDSIQILVHNTPEIEDYVQICNGDSIWCGGQFQILTGTYYDSLLTIYNCDSVIITHVTVNPTYQIPQTIFMCPYDSVFLSGSYQHLQGIYYDTLQSKLFCDSIIETEIVFHPLPSYPLSADTIICLGDTIDLDAKNPGSGYLWSNGSNSPVLSVSDSGIYVLTVTNSQNCRIVDSITVDIQTLPVFGMLPSDPIICKDSSVLLTFSQFYQYSWTPLESLTQLTDSSFIANPWNTTQYVVTALDTIGCKQDTNFLVVVKFPPESEMEDTISSCFGLPIQLGTGNQPSNVSFLWSTGESISEILASEPGVYWVILTNEVCKTTDTIIIEECPEIDIPNVFTPNGDGLNETFHPKGEPVPGYKLFIYNRWGVLLFQTTDFFQGWNGQYHGADCPDGTYYYLVMFEDPALQQNQEIIKKSGVVTLIRD